MRLLQEEALDNMNRVHRIIGLFEKAEALDIGLPEEREEVLRAAVVLLHSSLEEVVRNLFVERLPKCSVDVLNELSYPTPGNISKTKGVLLGDLFNDYQGRFVDNVIVDAINYHIDRMNINNSTQLSAMLHKVNIDTQELKSTLNELDELMKRRHQIVHQMDRNDRLDPDTRPISPIDLETVRNWFSAMEHFNKIILQQP